MLLPLGLYAYAAYNELEYWTMYRGERHTGNWLSSVQCLLLGVVAWANFVAQALATELKAEVPRRVKHLHLT